MAQQDEYKGSCFRCGYLALRHRTTRRLDEAEDTFRSIAREPTTYAPTLYEPLPVCFARTANLVDEVAQLVKARLKTPEDRERYGLPADGVGFDPTRASGLGEFVQERIQFDRRCPDWVKWDQGFTPKEHREILDRNSLLKWRFAELALVLLTIAAILATGWFGRVTIINNIEQPSPASQSEKGSNGP